MAVYETLSEVIKDVRDRIETERCQRLEESRDLRDRICEIERFLGQVGEVTETTLVDQPVKARPNKKLDKLDKLDKTRTPEEILDGDADGDGVEVYDDHDGFTIASRPKIGGLPYLYFGGIYRGTPRWVRNKRVAKRFPDWKATVAYAKIALPPNKNYNKPLAGG